MTSSTIKDAVTMAGGWGVAATGETPVVPANCQDVRPNS